MPKKSRPKESRPKAMTKRGPKSFTVREYLLSDMSGGPSMEWYEVTLDGELIFQGNKITSGDLVKMLRKAGAGAKLEDAARRKWDQVEYD
jgi:hypothetical protein